MIETFAHAEIPLPWALEGIKTWSYANLNLYIPWFFVEYNVIEDEQPISGMCLLFQDKQLSDLANQEGVMVDRAYLVSPSYLNKSDSWKMGLLKSVITGFVKTKQGDEKVTRYELSDGTEYLTSELKINKKHENEVVIYSC